MKTYREECQELLDWATAEDKKIDAELKASGFKGRDGPGVEKHNIVSREYYRRLAELKKKHGKNITVTSGLEPADSDAKTQKHKQAIQT